MNNSSTAKPGLFGITNSNRDFSKKTSWGKNQFNSSFPAALCAYFKHLDLKANYLTIKEGRFGVYDLDITSLFNIDSLDNVYYDFESPYMPYGKHLHGKLPRTDLVIKDNLSQECQRGIEIKLTTIPDRTTHTKSHSEYGSEIVIRPNTIVYLACSLLGAIRRSGRNTDYIRKVAALAPDDTEQALSASASIISCLHRLAFELADVATPLLLQPIWKTEGMSFVLAENCLDLFVWSDVALCMFISDVSRSVLESDNTKMTRQIRTAIWLFTMIQNGLEKGKFDHESIYDKMSYNLKNDKAFAATGATTNAYMKCENLTNPRIKRSEFERIILNKGQNCLSPERRLDAVLSSNLSLFTA